MNPILLEVLWNRLLSVANEQQTALMRTAFSTIVRESQDLACGLFDTRAQMIAQSLTGTPGHINPMATGVRHLLAVYPPDTLRPGDVLTTNDPWLTSGQVNDFTVLTPVFRGERIVGRELPEGRYENEVMSDGFEEPIRSHVSVTIAGEEIAIDFAGSSPQSRRGINVVFNYTQGYASFAMKAAVSPEVPHNDGAFRPVHVSAPRGSILNCVEPAAVASRHLVGHFLPGAIFGALAPALPGRLMAGSAD